MNKPAFPLASQKNIVVQDLNGELLIYDLKINKAYCLNETSAFVYRMCDGGKSVRQISRLMSDKLQKPVPEDLVWLAVDQLKQSDLLSDNNEIEINFNGVARREAIKKIGLASMIALPVISTLLAPTAAMAQSNLAAVCSAQSCDCADAFVLANAPGTPCVGANLVTPCPSPGCSCFVRDNDPIGTDICAA